MTGPNQLPHQTDPQAKVVSEHADAAAARAAELPSATPESIEAARQASAGAAGRLIGLEIVDSSSQLQAAERSKAAEHWRDVASNPDATEAERAEAALEAEAVQREADNHAGVNDPAIRPEGYQPITDEQIAASHAKVMGTRRV